MVPRTLELHPSTLPRRISAVGEMISRPVRWPGGKIYEGRCQYHREYRQNGPSGRIRCLHLAHQTVRPKLSEMSRIGGTLPSKPSELENVTVTLALFQPFALGEGVADAVMIGGAAKLGDNWPVTLMIVPRAPLVGDTDAIVGETSRFRRSKEYDMPPRGSIMLPDVSIRNRLPTAS
jgi:hypothetical protein